MEYSCNQYKLNFKPIVVNTEYMVYITQIKFFMLQVYQLYGNVFLVSIHIMNKIFLI